MRVPSLRDAEEPPETGRRTASAEISAAPAGGLTPEMRAQLDLMLRDHGIELRRFVAQSLSQHTGQIISEVRTLMDGGNDQAAPSPVRVCAPRIAGSRAVRAVRRCGSARWPRPSRCSPGCFGITLRMTGRRSVAQRRALRAARRAVGLAPAARSRRRRRRPWWPRTCARSAAARNAAVVVEPVPYGESPLGGARIDAVQNILARLVAAGFRGTVEIRSIPGRFCLQGTRRYGDAAGRGA